MSVLIKGMEMPKNCGECQFCHTENFTTYCCPTGREDILYDEIPEWCPLEEPKTGECKTCKHFVIGEIDGKTHVCEHPEMQLENYYHYACIMMEKNDFCSRYEPREKEGDEKC